MIGAIINLIGEFSTNKTQAPAALISLEFFHRIQSSGATP
jgi:hypothetical protein